jgi:hypothetical protein
MMTRDDANIIIAIPDLHWVTLCKLIQHDRDNIREMLENPTNHRDTDMLHKGALAFSKQVLGYKETAQKILNEKKEE